MNLKRALIAAAALAALPASAFAQSVFDVNVTFSPDTSATTTAYIICNGGVPLEQQFPGLGDGDGVDFVVEETNDTTDCTITVDDVAGYTASLSGGDGDCVYTNIGADFAGRCIVDFSADDVSFSVTKTWDLSGTGGNLLDPSYEIEIRCDEEITDAPGASDTWNDKTYWYAEWKVRNTADQTFTVDVAYADGGPACRAEETIFDSSVESVSNCGREVNIPLGGSRGCSISNTVFYEGIPTLSQYGLAVMVLLMLGVGFIGFRRFV